MARYNKDGERLQKRGGGNKNALFNCSKYEGRKTCEEYVEFARQGKSAVQIAARMGVCRDTLSDWARKYPEFAVARKLANDLVESWYTDLTQAIAAGKLERGNIAAAKWAMTNLCGWTEKQKTDVDLGANCVSVEFVDPPEYDE